MALSTARLVLLLGALSALTPASIDMYLPGFPVRAGSASALFGVLQFGVATFASALVGALHDGTARPMAVVMGVCGAGALATYRMLGRHRTG